MVKQLGIHTYFSDIAMSWSKIGSNAICQKMNHHEEELKYLSYQKRCNQSNNNPVFVASHFQNNL